jgi:hypothetical protein
MTAPRLASWIILLLASFASAQTTQPAAGLHAGSEEEYRGVFELPGVTPQQRATLQQRIDDRNAALRAWVQSEAGRQLVAIRAELLAARASGEADAEAARQRLRDQAKPLAEVYFNLRTRTRLDVLRELTSDQLAHYAARAIRARALRGLDDVAWPADQSDHIDQLALDAARAHLASHPLEADPFFHRAKPFAADLRVRVASEIMTSSQRR